MKIAAIQMTSTASLATNLQDAQRLLEQAARQGAELAVLPEYFCLLGHQDSDKLRLQEPLGKGPIQQFLADAARQLGLWVVGGTMPITPQSAADDPAVPTAGRAHNTSLVFAPDGHCAARYDKIHLFSFDNGREHYQEAQTLRPGRQPVTFRLPSRDGHVWTVGLSVCYDLRFPELYRHHARQGADLLLVPSAFTATTGEKHWEVLLRARAIENLCYVAAAAQGGAHENGRQTWGHSMLIDPWGQVLAVQAQGAGVVCAEFDADALARQRQQLPALSHRVL